MALSSPKAGLAGAWEGTNMGLIQKDFVLKEEKKRKAKILELHVTPCLPADVELGTLCAAAATFLFSSLRQISTRLLPL